MTREHVLAGLRIFDCLAVFCAAVIAWWFRYETLLPPLPLMVVVTTTLVATILFEGIGLYRRNYASDLGGALRRSIFASICLAAIILSVLFATKSTGEYSRIWLTIWFSIIPVALVAGRSVGFLVIAYASARPSFRAPVAVLGATRCAERLIDHLRKFLSDEIDIIGIFDDRIKRSPATLRGIPLLGTSDDLIRFARQNRLAKIFVALPWEAETRLFAIRRKLMTIPVDSFLVPAGIAYELSTVSHQLNDFPMVPLHRRQLAGWAVFAKRVEDIILALLLLMALAPLFLVIAVIIKIDSPGPVFFRQRRYGYNNQVISILKFRTMYHSDEIDPSVTQARRNDPRITRVGSVLRRLSLDELPQLVNVLGGKMSLVGPRPHAVPHNEHYMQIIDAYSARHNVKPGMTGWAQVNGLRGEIEGREQMQKRLEYDLHYIESWSLGFDCRILLQTVAVVIGQENAY